MSAAVLSHKEELELYELGKQARAEGKESNRCPYGVTNAVRRSWWLAGWHDADMELTA